MKQCGDRQSMTECIKALFFICCVLWSMPVGAQTIDDALLMSTRDRVGSSRGVGVGGSMSTLGGDFGSIAVNPAAAGSIHISEYQFTPGFVIAPAESSVISAGSSGEPRSVTRSNFIIASGGYVQTNRFTNGSQSHTNFAVGINRVADFNEKFEFEDVGPGSITSYFVERSDFLNPDNLDAFVGGPAFDALITSVDPNTLEYAADIDGFTEVTKRELVDRWGGIDEIIGAFAVNLDQNWQFGIGVQIPVFKLDVEKQYEESASGQPIYRSVAFEQDLKIRGSGISLQIGAKTDIKDKLHLGIAVHSPSWMTMVEEFSTTATYDYNFDPDIFDQQGPTSADSPEGTFEYDFRTPLRVVGSAGLLLGKLGFITVESEWVDYTMSKFTIPDDTGFELDLNRQIDELYQSVLYIRSGAEIKLKSWRLRGGASFSQSALTSEEGNMELDAISLGLGKWFDNVFVDAAWRHRSRTQFYSPFILSSPFTTEVESDLNASFITLTIGVKLIHN